MAFVPVSSTWFDYGADEDWDEPTNETNNKWMEQMNADSLTVLAFNPFKTMDVSFAKAARESGVLPVIEIDGAVKDYGAELWEFSRKLGGKFGTLFQGIPHIDFDFPAFLEFAIITPDVKVSEKNISKCVCQVTSCEQAKKAEKNGAFGVLLKGNEAAGPVGEETSFILFRQIIKEVHIPVWVQGGVGLHASAAFMAMGAKGVFLDYQLSLFPELHIDKKLASLIKHLEGAETKVINAHRLYVEPDAVLQHESIDPGNADEIQTRVNRGKVHLLSQDIGSAFYYYKKYKKLGLFLQAVKEAVIGHIRQAKFYNPIRPESPFSNGLGVKYPLVQGPMARVSDKPAFAAAIAREGALPFLALSTVTGTEAGEMLDKTAELMQGKTWGVGILGFVPEEIRNAQFKLIEKYKPAVVMIAGGRPSQAKPFEKMGIKVFLHVPSPALLDLYLKEGAKNFVFEGRESGGHVGSLASLPLWEKQIERLLDVENPEQINVLFAGGISDALSAAFVATMSAPLAAKGIKIGLQMGSAYLYTKEAVGSGAILQQFQEQIIHKSATVLVESGKGHTTRCLNTPFVDFFENQKHALKEEGKQSGAIKPLLEKLNIGRLRIATKGIERKKGELVQVNEETQLQNGMYMVGQVVALHQGAISIKQLHQETVNGCGQVLQKANIPEMNFQSAPPMDIAVIGISCIFPGAKNLDEFWKNILYGTYSISEVPPERWDKTLYYSPGSTDNDKTPSKLGGFIPTINFDPTKFGIAPQSLYAIDPAQLLGLHVANEALKDAGYDKREFDRENTSVVFGVDGGGSDLSAKYNFRSLYLQLFGQLDKELDDELPKLTEDSFPGILANVIAGRIANRLDLGGKNYTVDAACASSLAALDVACLDLVSQKSNMALVGGIDLHNNIRDYLMFNSTKALSKKGLYQTFDRQSDGIILGEGVAVLVLKRLDEAKRDGDKIYSVIKGIGASSDGKSLGLTAPRKEGQLRAFSRAYQQAGVHPSEVGLVEVHGTGTVVGDRTELSSMTDFFINGGAVNNQINISSIKPQIGHTKCASGLAGLIKASLCVYNGVVPPIINLQQPNAFYQHETSPFAFNNASSVWTSEHRVAGISAFGFGGSNYHCVIENKDEANGPTLKSWPSEMFVFRGNNSEEAMGKVNQVRALLQINPQIRFKDIAYTLAEGNQSIQWVIVAKDAVDLLQKLDRIAGRANAEGVYKLQPFNGKVAFLFSGQGSQRIHMAKGLFVNFPFFRKFLKSEPSLEKIIFPFSVYTEEHRKKQADTINDTQVAQPLLGITDYAIASFLTALGIVPDMVAGHSYGEIPALCYAQVFDEKYLVDISRKRAASILKSLDGDHGAMLAVSCKAPELLDILKDQEKVYLANYNAPRQLVVAGETSAIQKLSERLKAMKVPYRKLPVACAFHTPLLKKSQAFFLNELSPFEFHSPQIPVWSNTSAEVYPDAPQEIKNRLSEHLVKPVLFCKEIENMYKANARVFIEVGPGKVLATLTGNILEQEHIRLSTENKKTDGITLLLNTLAQYITSGREIKLGKLFEGRDAQIIDLLQPEQYKPAKTTWHINGHTAYPMGTREPSTKRITKKLQKPETMEALHPAEDNFNSKLITQYLENVRTIIQSQHEIIMNYLGKSPEKTGLPEVGGIFQEEPPQLKVRETFSKDAASDNKNNIAENPVNNNTEQLTRTSLTNKLLEVVSEKTGYPEEMLGMEMDLEADLSIDSIKRVEIIGTLKNEFSDILKLGGQEDEVVEHLSTLKTLNGLVDWMYEEAQAGQSPILQGNVPGKSTTGAIPKPLTPDSIKETLLRTVSEKTGYPEEMLGMEMDLEADLSIDSIKRVEIIGTLKTEFSGVVNFGEQEDEIIEHLSSIKTLNGLAGWIFEAAQASQPSKPEINVQKVATPAVMGEPLTMGAIKETLLRTVSEKTGYPEEMLGMEMDLEADLSIDSIKRIEIIGNLKTHFKALQELANADDDVTERLASIKTLSGLADWIFSSATHEIHGTEPGTIPDKPVEPHNNVEGLMRLGYELVLSEIEKYDTEPLANNKFVVVGNEEPTTSLLREKLRECGLDVDIASEKYIPEHMDGLIFPDLASLDHTPTIHELYACTQKLDSKKVKWVYVVTDYKSSLKQANGLNALNRVQGYAGFMKCLNKEWKAKCRVIHVETGCPLGDMAHITANELSANPTDVEVCYKQNKRYTWQLEKKEHLRKSKTLHLEKNDVVLVLGGAQGITSEMVKEMSAEYPCHYILVGRTPLPQNGAINKYASIVDKEVVKQELLSVEKFDSPKALEEKAESICKQNQIINTLNSIKSNGAAAIYKAVDLRNEAAVKELFDEIYATHKQISGIIHGAGYLADKLVIHKTKAKFEQVYTTKVTPLKVWAENMRPDLKFMVLFSSIASTMGNKGQTDYAAANSVLDDFAAEIQSKYNIRAVAINWGPWKSKGMVSKELENDFLARGIASIAIENGVQAFMDELRFGKDSQVTLMARMNEK